MTHRLAVFFACWLMSFCLRADRWDIAQGNHVLATSPLIFPAERMFGDPGVEPAGVETGSCIFADADPPGLRDFVEFRTDEEVPLTGYTLTTGADFLVNVIRGVKTFSLWADTNRDGTFVRIDSFEPLQPVDNAVTRTFPMVVTDHWLIEVFRPDFPAPLGDILGNGPRVVELDAIEASNPDFPVVNILSPTNQSTFTEGDTVVFDVEASDASQGIKRVEIIDVTTDTVLASTNRAPFHFVWSNAPAGNHLIKAKAVDDLGGAGYSDQITLTVAQKLPNIFLSSAAFDPAGGFSFNVTGFDFGPSLTFQVSNDLVTWSDLIEATPDSDPYLFADPSFIPRFYRVRQAVQ